MYLEDTVPRIINLGKMLSRSMGDYRRGFDW
jgi:hypothetical protein